MEDEINTKRVTIGYLIPFIWGDLSISLIKGVHERAKQLDVNLLCVVGQKLNDTSKKFTKQANIVYDLVDKEFIDGVIILGSQITKGLSEDEADKFYNKFKDKEIPMVGVSTLIKDCYNVITDDKEGINAIIEHFIEYHNYTKIGFICAGENNHVATLRLEAYKEGLEKFGLTYRPELVSDYYDFTMEAGRRGTRQLLEERHLQPGQDIQAIIAPSDIVAMGVSEELRRLGIRCPEEIAIAGFENRIESKICNPALTTIDLSFTQQGLEAVGLLVNIIKNNTKPENIVVPGRLIIRSSCGVKEFDLEQIKISNNKNYEKITGEQIQKTIKDIQKRIIPFYYTIDHSWVENMVISFIEDIENDYESNRFLSTLNVYLEIIFSHNEEVSNFQNIITLMRNAISPLITNYKNLLKSTDIWNKARIIINQVSEIASVEEIKKNDKSLFIIYYTEQRLMSTFILEEFLDIIEIILKEINVTCCYISMYTNNKELFKDAKLIFAYAEKTRIDISDKYYFNSKEIVPKKLRITERRCTYILNPLYYKDIPLGFVVYETDTIDSFVFDTLSLQISSGLYKIKIFQQLKETEEERKSLLKKMEKENSYLEQKIEESTSDIKNVNKQLQKSINKANSASEAKSRFLANMSHEIRTPLNCIIGFSEILNTMDHPTEQYGRYTSLIAQEASKLSKLINQILDISKIESGQMKLVEEVFDMHSCMETITSTYSMMAQTKGLYYRVYGFNIIPQFIIGDSMRLKQILSNILSNALKFTSKGGITVSLEVAEEKEDKIKILFNIKDTGIGIPYNSQKHIFDNFVQAEDNTTRKYGGTGLGTAISKQLVEMMGGTIGVDSIEGEGSTFWFTGIFGKTSQTYIDDSESYKLNKEINISNKQLANCTVMIVEDYAINRELAKIHLANIGCKIIEAVNGKYAVEFFAKNQIDLILMDIQMAEMDGCEATKIIRKTPKGKKIPIIGMTANVFESDIERYISIGMNDVIIKPFKKDDFQYKVLLWLSKAKNGTISEKIKHVLNLKNNTEVSSDKEKYIDIERNLRELDNDIEFFMEITTEFLKNAKSQVPIIAEAANNNNYEVVTREAHSIKGGALNLSAKPLSDIATTIEEKGRNKNITDIDKLLIELNKIIIKTEEYLNAKIS